LLLQFITTQIWVTVSCVPMYLFNVNCVPGNFILKCILPIIYNQYFSSHFIRFRTVNNTVIILVWLKIFIIVFIYYYLKLHILYCKIFDGLINMSSTVFRFILLLIFCPVKIFSRLPVMAYGYVHKKFQFRYQ